MAPIDLPVHQPFRGGPRGVKPMDGTGFSGVQQRRPVTEGKGFKPLYAPGPVPSSGTTD